MGLDMYLEKRKKDLHLIVHCINCGAVLKYNTCTSCGRDYVDYDEYVKFAKKFQNSSKDEWEEIMYWRKANQIREWFAENLDGGVENCEYSPVTKEDLEALVADCKAVLADHSKASELLPTSSGFFFGSTEYDKWYFEDLEETVEKLSNIISETNWDEEEVAYCEWW